MADENLKPVFYDTASDYEYRIYACNPLNFKASKSQRVRYGVSNLVSVSLRDY